MDDKRIEVILLLSAIALFWFMQNPDIFIPVSWPFALISILLFMLLHLLKLGRYYLILSESGISLGRYLRIYFCTTLINVLLPFKIGEIFRFYLVGRTCKRYSIAFLSIVTERFFDTSVVVAILFAQAFFEKALVSWVLPLLSLVVFTIFLLYIAYPTTAAYLNSLFVMKRSNPRDVYVLRTINVLDRWYRYESGIVHGKGLLVFLLSVIAWATEFLFLQTLAKALGLTFSIRMFYSYISGILSPQTELSAELLNTYSLVCIAVFSLFYVLVRVYSGLKRRRIA